MKRKDALWCGFGLCLPGYRQNHSSNPPQNAYSDMRAISCHCFYLEASMNHQPTATYFFLGANSRHGFYSLYDEFANGERDILHIIKSGPGTGKSTFMKQIGKAAEAKGLDVEYILCSGDPESLDGIYIPALHIGWADGTAPHILEPKHFGVDGTYTDLGQFCRQEYLNDNSSQIKTVTSAYRLCYQKAYIYLQAAGNLQYNPTPLPVHIEERIRSRAKAKIKKELSDAESSTSLPMKRFLRAISCQGDYRPAHTLNTLCDRLCILESNIGLDSIFFDEILKSAEERKILYIRCLSPLSPEHTETVIFPDIRLCFASSQAVLSFHGSQRTIHLDSYLDDMNKNEYKQREKLNQQLMNAAYKQLSRAKQFHDELERYYRPALNVDALNDYTQSVIHKLFP